MFNLKRQLEHLSSHLIYVMLLLVCVSLLGGCAPSVVEDPLSTNYSRESDDGDLDFWHDLAARDVVSNDEAFHALTMSIFPDETIESYEERVKLLKGKGMLPDWFNRPANEVVTRGILAQIIFMQLDVKGGMTIQLFGVTPRYALRELVYMEIMPASSKQQGISGVEFIGIITKAEDYQEKKK